MQYPLDADDSDLADAFNDPTYARAALQHHFKSTSYKLKASYCCRCDGVIGLTSQELRCTRCDLTFHKRCVDDQLSKACPQRIQNFGVAVARGIILLEPRILHHKYKGLLAQFGYPRQAHSFISKLYKLDSACTSCRTVLKGMALQCQSCGCSAHQGCSLEIGEYCLDKAYVCDVIFQNAEVFFEFKGEPAAKFQTQRLSQGAADIEGQAHDPIASNSGSRNSSRPSSRPESPFGSALQLLSAPGSASSMFAPFRAGRPGSYPLVDPNWDPELQALVQEIVLKMENSPTAQHSEIVDLILQDRRSRS